MVIVIRISFIGATSPGFQIDLGIWSDRELDFENLKVTRIRLGLSLNCYRKKSSILNKMNKKNGWLYAKPQDKGWVGYKK